MAISLQQGNFCKVMLKQEVFTLTGKVIVHEKSNLLFKKGELERFLT